MSAMPQNGFQIDRFDRLATLYLCHPVTRLFGAKSSSRLPILMYHSVSDNLFGKSHPYYQINTSPRVFAQQMKWLHEAGYQTLNLSQLRLAMDADNVPPKTVVITFDDGYQDFVIDAFSPMRRYGFTATIFLATGRIQDTPA